MSGGKNGTPATQTQKSEPWGPAQPYLKNILGQANTLRNQGGSYYPFSTTVPFSPETNQSLSGMENYANNGSQLFGQSRDALSGVLTGNTSNPALSGLYQTAAGNSDFGKQLFDSLKGDVTNSVNDQFSLSGRTGSPAQVDEMTKQLGNLATNVYGQERGYQQNAQNTLAQMINSGMGQASNVWQQGADPLKMLGQVGQAYEGQAGNQLQDLMGRWDYSQNANQDSLSKLAGIVGPVSGAGGTSSGTAASAQPSGAQQALSTAATIASIVAAFSDPAAKEDIQPVDGISVLQKFRAMSSYTYRYKQKYGPAFSGQKIGPMADDFAREFGGDGHVIPMPQIIGALCAAVTEIAKKLEDIEGRLK